MNLVIKTTLLFFRIIIGIILSLLLISSITLLQSKIYNFSDPEPFSGDYLFNPYSDISGKWYKANFHTHAKTWGGLTYGAQTGDKVISKYKSMGYDIICISDYHSINKYLDTTDPLFIPVYEHGYNIKKSHRLAIGSEEVSFFDIPLFQSLSHKQYIIERIKKSSPYVAIVHPKLMNGHSKEELKYLEGYNFLEVLNHFTISDKYWDAALSEGKLVWIISDDDSHNAYKTHETGVMWTMINAKEASSKSILSSLSNGKAYGVAGRNGINDNYLKRCEVENLTFQLETDSPATEIKLIGQNSAVKSVSTNTDRIRYAFQPDDSYIRAEITNKDSKIYLNPIIRFNGKIIPRNSNNRPNVNLIKTILMRTSIALIDLVIIMFLFRKKLFRVYKKVIK